MNEPIPDGLLLVIADDPRQGELAIGAIQDRIGKIAVHMTSNGYDALLAMVQLRPTALILAVQTLTADGINLLEITSAEPAYADIPILVLAELSENHTIDMGDIPETCQFIDKRAGNWNAVADFVQQAFLPRSSKVVIIIEPNPLVSATYRFAINRIAPGMRVIETDDARSALLEIAISRPAAILMDIALPDLGGMQVIETLKCDPDYANIPIVVLTDLTPAKIAAMGVIPRDVSVVQKTGWQKGGLETFFRSALRSLVDQTVVFPAINVKPEIIIGHSH
jgi:CheY-like chemotaxis protein